MADEARDKFDLRYFLFGFWIRREACRLAASAFCPDEDGRYTPRLWGLTVFFESYLLYGSAGTREDFGPKDDEEERPAQKTVVQLIVRDD